MKKRNKLLSLAEGEYNLLIDEDTVELDFSGILTKQEVKALPKVPKLLRAVNAYTLDGEYVASYESIQEARKAENVSSSIVYKCCRGIYLSSSQHNRIFLYRGDDIDERLKLIEERNKKYNCTGRFINEYSLNGRFLFQYSQLKLAAKANKVSSKKIAKCCRGEIPHLNNRIFLYSEDNIKDRMPAVKEAIRREKAKRTRNRPIDEYTLDGQYVRGFISCSEAAREYGIHVSAICRCCKGQCDKYHNTLQIHDRVFLYTGDSISARLELINSLKTDKYVR